MSQINSPLFQSNWCRMLRF